MAGTILVVDDSEVVRKLIEFQLTQEGYTILTAHNGAEGVRMARKHEPDVIIMDVQMPEMDGYEASRLIRQVHATMHTPIIMLTSLSSISNMQAGYDAGVDDYLTKPFQPNELQLRVSAVMRRVKRTQASVQESEKSVIGILSLRGGTGCTSLATNLAIGLTDLWDSSAVLLDLSTPMGTCDVHLDVRTDSNLSTMLQHDVRTADDELIRGYLEEHSSGIRFLAGIQSPIDAELFTENLVSVILDTAIQDAYYTVIDLPHDFGPITLTALDKLDQILMPITPDLVSSRLAKNCLNILETLGFNDDKVQVIVNWTGASGGISTEQIENYLRHKILVTIPHVPGAWNEAINLGTPIITTDSEHPMVGLLEDICWKFSTITDRSRKDSQRTPMWQRISKRRMKRSAEQAKLNSKKPSRFKRKE